MSGTSSVYHPMLDNLTARLAKIVKQIRGEARLTEANIQDALREVRVALLEADVALPVVKHFIEAVRASALGEEVIGSLTPGQALVGLVHRELARLMGGANVGLDLATQPPAVILMAGLQAVRTPEETLFIVAARQGQDAVTVRRAFDAWLPRTGVILTKLDGDAGGGVTLSVRQVPGKPIKFAGVGEMLGGIEPFHPERMAARILGMGDILGLVEEAHARIDLDEAQRVAEKLKRGRGFDLEDFKAQIAQMKKMGGVAALLDKLPAQLAGQISPAQLQDDRQIRRIEGIINSMTPAERADPSILKASRKRRIAAGAGVPGQAVNQLLNQFEQMQKMMKMMKGGNMARMLRNMKGMLPGLR